MQRLKHLQIPSCLQNQIKINDARLDKILKEDKLSYHGTCPIKDYNTIFEAEHKMQKANLQSFTYKEALKELKKVEEIFEPFGAGITNYFNL